LRKIHGHFTLHAAHTFTFIHLADAFMQSDLQIKIRSN